MPRSRFALPALFIVLAFLGSAATGEARAVIGSGCPADPSKCTVYAQESIQVGPVMVTIDLAAANGSAEQETTVVVAPGGEGTLSFSLLANTSSSGSTINATLEVNATDRASWSGERVRALSYVAQAGIPARETFAFDVAKDASLGPLPLPFTITVGEESVWWVLTLLVAEPAADARIPGPAVGLVALAVVALAGVLGRERRER